MKKASMAGIIILTILNSTHVSSSDKDGYPSELFNKVNEIRQN